MRSLMRVILAASVFSGGAAFAQATAPEDKPTTPMLAPIAEEPAAGPQWELGVGVLGFVNGSFFSEPADEDKVRTSANGTQRLTLYPGFGGVGGGGGLSFTGMWRGIVGLEIGAGYSLDQGKGQLQTNRGETDFTLTQTAWHVPILLRVAAPLDQVRPLGWIGVEWVVPGAPDVEVSGPLVAGLDAEADTYMTLAFGFGFEFKVYESGPNELRIPFLIRGRWNPSLGTGLDGRVNTDKCAADVCTFITEWEYQAEVNLGLAWYFLI
jgi:hypothetical protein